LVETENDVVRRLQESKPRPARTAKRRGAGASRAALLAAAQTEFAAHGFAGARVDRIARRAGVNKQLVYHYFGGKDDLYAETLEGVYAHIRSLEQGLHLSDLGPGEAMSELVGFSFDYLSAHPEFISLLNDENVQAARHVRRSRRLSAMNSPLIGVLDDTLDRGVKAGLFRPGVDPLYLYISIAGLSYFFFSNSRTLSAIFGRDLRARKAVASYRRHVVEFVLRALTSGGRLPGKTNRLVDISARRP
jgi:TetR/AcrR family transcriptional regulator